MRILFVKAVIFAALLSLSLGSTVKEQEVGAFDMDAIKGSLKEAESKYKDYELPQNAHSAQGEKEAEKAVTVYQSEEFQQKIQSEVERLKDTVFSKQLEEYLPKQVTKEGRSPSPGVLSQTERIYIFVSSSMPVQTIRSYAGDVDRLRDPNVAMVMRGFIGGMKYVKPTIEFARKVLVKDENCRAMTEKCETFSSNLEIDPLLFRKYGITSVPAVVYARGVRIADPGQSEGYDKNVKVSDYYAVYGDASLEYAIRAFHKETKSPSLEGMIRKLRGGFYSSR
jgi:type-F conjugative transfer system pilin assembly protein TrbC